MEMTNKWAYALGDEEDYNGVFLTAKRQPWKRPWTMPGSMGIRRYGLARYNRSGPS